MPDEPLSLEERERLLKERELRVKEGEIAAKEKEIARSKWLNPVVLGLFAAALGLVGNIFVTLANNNNIQNIEHFRAQSTLILEAIKTNGDTKTACKNLGFFLSLGLLDDTNKTIIGACPEANQGVPTLPSSNPGNVQILTPVEVSVENASGELIPGALVHLEDNVGRRSECPTNSGVCFFVPLPIGTPLHIRVTKEGYSEVVVNTTWMGSPIVVKFH